LREVGGLVCAESFSLGHVGFGRANLFSRMANANHHVSLYGVVDHLPITGLKDMQGYDGTWKGDDIWDGKESDFH
jgi:hypothetical protein